MFEFVDQLTPNWFNRAYVYTGSFGEFRFRFAVDKSTNTITATAAFVVSVIPDTVRLCAGKISGKEFGKRTACNGAGAVGGTGGAWVGAAIGSCICPGIGTAIGGFIGGIAGGVGASAGVGRLFYSKRA